MKLVEFECRFCNKIFGNKQNLLQHQTKAKYCLNLQKNSFEDFNYEKMSKEYEEKIDYKEKQKIKCPFCNSIFANIFLLDQHQKRAKYCLKIQETNAKEKDEKALLEAKVKEIEENKAKAEEQALKEKIKELTCQFCSKEFKTKYLLNNHQTHTKYCLKLQESQNYKQIISALVTCKFCTKNFSDKNFSRHDAICKKKNEFLIKENDKLKAEKDQEKVIVSIYKNLAERSQAAFEEIAKKPTYQKNSIRNIQNNLMISSLTPLDLTQVRVDSIIDEKYTKNDFYEGQKGAAQVIHKHILTDSNGKSQIVCTDTERGTFHHIDVNGEHVVDYKNVHLIDRVHLPLKRKASKFAAEESIKNPTAFKDIVMNETSIRELEIKPGLFNRTMAKLTGKNCARQLITTIEQLDLSITEEWLLENAKFLSIEHILRGPEGYADYALTYPLNERLIIDDDYYDSKHKVAFLKYKNFKGDIITDVNGLFLGKMIIDSLDERVKILAKDNESIYIDYKDDNFISLFIEFVVSNI